MDSAIVVFTRDLRLHDNPALHQARTGARQVVPLFVADPALDATRRSPNRARFLAGSLAGLREALRERGADLVIRAGEPAAAVIQLAREVNAGAVYLAGDVSHYAAARRARLERECARHRIDLTFTPGLTVVPPGLAAEPPLAAAPAGRLRREPRRPGRRPDLAPVRLSEVRLRLAARGGDRRARPPRRRGVLPPARLARLLPPGDRGVPRHRQEELPPRRGLAH
jgi:hypothetical protein